MAQIIPLKGRPQDADAKARPRPQRPELVIFPGVNLGMLREAVQESKATKAPAKGKAVSKDLP